MGIKWLRYFVLAAGGFLLSAALIRLLVVTGSAQVLAVPDPMLGIPLRYTVLAVSMIELVVALICLFGKRLGLQIGWLVWLSVNLTVFWLGLVWMHYPPQGTCIGSLTDPLRLYHGITAYVMDSIPACFVLASYVAGLWFWFSKEGRMARFVAAQEQSIQRDAVAGLLKISCPACGRHIKFAAENLNQKIPCPQCQTVIKLRKPEETLKISCFFCKEHIEFPSHAIGEKMPCPHCKMDITLKEPA